MPPDAKGGKPGLGGLDIIVGMGKPKGPRGPMGSDMEGPEEDAAEGEEEPDDMQVGAAHDIMEAFYSKDAAGLAAALKSFVSMC